VSAGTCPRCGAPLGQGPFCPTCGARCQPTHCPRCGTQQQPGSAYCGQCGAPLRAAPPAAPGAPPPTPVPPAPPAPAPARQARLGGCLKVALGVVAVCLVLIVGLIALAGQSPPNAPSGAGSPRPTAAPTIALAGTPAAEVSAAGVTLQRPSGWASQDNKDKELVIAARQADLTSAVPDGPRLRVEPAGRSPVTAADLEQSVPTGSAGSLVVAAEPAEVTVGGIKGVGVLLRETRGGRAVNFWYVVADAGAGQVYLFTAEAPADQWSQHSGTLQEILRGARFAGGR
jgi:hypothetical protein